MSLMISTLLIPLIVIFLVSNTCAWRYFPYNATSNSSYAYPICGGTDSGLSHTRGDPVSVLEARFTNCTKIFGNLEIVHLKQKDFTTANVTSLDHIFARLEQITGYLLIYSTDLINISFPSLEVIYGDTQFTPTLKNASVLVSGNKYLRYINFKRLKVIDRGHVIFFNNPYLCFLNRSIDWTQLFNEDVSTRLIFNADPYSLSCSISCDRSCHNNRCWGPGPDMCQSIYRDNCAPQCSYPSMRQCFKPQDSPSCCHASCAGGCTGPMNTNCTFCALYTNGDECVDACPKRIIYNPNTRKRVLNPDGKYTHGRECVEKCPAHMDVYDDMCLVNCPSDHYADRDNGNLCTPCNGLCPKTCQTKSSGNLVEPLDVSWVGELTNCTKLIGPLIINGLSQAYLKTVNGTLRSVSLTIKDLEILSTLREITGYLEVSNVNFHGALKDLSFLRNLELIHGKILKSTKWSIYIASLDEIEELGLVSLEDGSILAGSVFISQNVNLCFSNVGSNWTKIFMNPSSQRVLVSRNRGADICEKYGDVCDENCSPTEGCWGKGPGQCYTCNHFKLNNTCVDTCESTSSMYIGMDNKTCHQCHPQCAVCFGPGSGSNCTRCRHARLDDECLSKCPVTHYTEGSNCVPCDQACYTFGCTGPSSKLGAGGCNKCNYAVINTDSMGVAYIDRCLHDVTDNEHKICASNKLSNYFAAAPGYWSDKVDKYICDKCDDTCATCTGKGREVINHGCHCLDYTVHNFDDKTNHTTDICAITCPRNYYESSQSECSACDVQCADGCNGPHSANCTSCIKLGILLPDGRVSCVAECPPEMPFEDSKMCSSINHLAARQAQDRTRTISTAIGVGCLVIFLLVSASLAFMFRRKYKNLEIFNRFFKIATPEMEPNPDAKPNMSKLRIISANEISRGRRLGSGAFGVVYQGLWTIRDKDEPTVKVPVALKELLDMSPSAQKEALNEAAVMASLNHPHLLKLVGVCISDSLMLITPLMLLGNLLDYVRNNNNTIGSEHLLRWIAQIASAMEYLELHRYVHRDLAARNVLVQNPSRVFVTDFGLAKMIDYGEKEVFVEGRVPIKWLALECIRYHRFTHKSDVWAFGVTAWELLNFGQKKPYGNTPITQIPALLERGERLDQPSCCTIDVYTALVSCWFVDTDCRPNFTELREKFTDMCKDPPRYLHIDNDRLRRGPRCTNEDQRQLMTDIWGDDPSLVSVGEYFDSGITTPSTPASPSTPSKPLMTLPPNRRPALANRNPSTGSYRYQASPFKHMESHAEEMNRGDLDDPCFSGCTSKSVDSRTMATDDENYLIPDRRVPSILNNEDFYPEPYTPIIFENGSPGKPPYYNIVQPLKNGGVKGKAEDAVDNDVYMQQNDENSIETETTV